MGLNPKTAKSMISRYRANAPGYGNFTISGVGLEEEKSLRILGVTFIFKLTFETHLREIGSKAARRVGVVRRAGKLFNCPHVLKSCFNACVWSSLEHCVPVWMSSVESHWASWMVLFAVRKGCAKVNFAVWGTEEESVPCVCSIRFITEWPTL